MHVRADQIARAEAAVYTHASLRLLATWIHVQNKGLYDLHRLIIRSLDVITPCHPLAPAIGLAELENSFQLNFLAPCRLSSPCAGQTCQ